MSMDYKLDPMDSETEISNLNHQQRLRHRVEVQSMHIEKLLAKNQIKAEVNGGSIRRGWIDFDIQAQFADGWQKFRHLTLPLIAPALLLALLFRTIDALRVFDLVFVMTQGGPADATNVLQFYGYKKTFAEGMVGYGSTIAVAVFLLSLTVAIVYLRVLKASQLRGATR